MSLTELRQLAVDHPFIREDLQRLSDAIDEFTADGEVSMEDMVTLEAIAGTLAAQIAKVEGYENGVSVVITDERLGRDEYSQSIRIEAQTELQPGHDLFVIPTLEIDLQIIDQHLEQQASLSGNQETFYAAADGSIAEGPDGTDFDPGGPKVV